MFSVDLMFSMLALYFKVAVKKIHRLHDGSVQLPSAVLSIVFQLKEACTEPKVICTPLALRFPAGYEMSPGTNHPTAEHLRTLIG